MNAPLTSLAADLMAPPTSHQIRLSRLYNESGVSVGKAYDLIEGKPVKRANVSAFASHCRVEVFDSVKALSDMIASLPGSSHLCAGVPVGGITEAKMTTKAKPRPGHLTRTKDRFELPRGPGIFLLDHDTQDAPEHLRFDQDKLHETLAAVLGLDWHDIGFVWYTSSSSYIRVEESGFSHGLRGHHTLLVVQDASDFSRFLEVVARRLIIAGFGYAHITADGRMSVRTVVDRTVANDPSCAIFSAVPDLAPGLVADSSMNYNEAPPLDTRSIPDLTLAEQHAYNSACDALLAVAASNAERIKASHRAERMASMLAKGVPIEQATAAYNGIGVQRLQSPWEILLDSGAVVTVAEILAAPAKYHNAPCGDPIEPEYRSGVARVYSDKEGSVLISSFAHGGRVTVGQQSTCSKNPPRLILMTCHCCQR